MIHVGKLWKSGNSWVVAIPGKILREAGIDEHATIRLQADKSGQIIITRVVWQELAKETGKGN